MAFTKKTWVNVPDPSNLPSIPGGQDALARFDAENMNRIEKGIEEAHTSKAPNGHGLGQLVAETPAHTTFQGVMQEGCGFYQVGTDVDTPMSYEEWMSLLQLVRNAEVDNETGVQLSFLDFHPDNPRMWLRTMLRGTAGDWVEMLHTGNAVNKLSNLGIPRFDSGSYVGTGTYGKANPISIPVPFKPRLMIIGRQDYVMSGIYGEFWFESTEYAHRNGGDEYIKYVNGKIMIYAHGSTNGAEKQYNANGATYRWYIFG